MRWFRSSLILCIAGLLGVIGVVGFTYSQRNGAIVSRQEPAANSAVPVTAQEHSAQTTSSGKEQSLEPENLSKQQVAVSSGPAEHFRRLKIGAVGIDVELEISNVENELLTIPERADRAGQWWSSGQPGNGPLIVAGHVTWGGKPGAFSRLDQVQQGQLLELSTQADIALYKVRQISVYSKQQLPEAIVGAQAPHQLVLVTCTGPMVSQELPDGSTVIEPRDNLVVVAEPFTVSR
ncbi:MAG: class F sortase [Propionibacteriaceae bacterium]